MLGGLDHLDESQVVNVGAHAGHRRRYAIEHEAWFDAAAHQRRFARMAGGL
jgi:hypothetical protein